jgi:ABC-2 type transport system ATP-binding protein
MITLQNLTKRFGDHLAVDNLTVEIQPGRVTGFLGPNGAGKSTTMRMILGLDRPTSGRALIDGRAYSDIPFPIRKVGALLDAKALHPGRSARNHLKSMARSNQIPMSRVDEVLHEVGIQEVAGRRAGTYSLGMSQRLGIAGALLGDPEVLIFDEPVNGLDPDGVRWVRRLARSLSAEGRTVLVSSHLMSEMQLTADHPGGDRPGPAADGRSYPGRGLRNGRQEGPDPGASAGRPHGARTEAGLGVVEGVAAGE